MDELFKEALDLQHEWSAQNTSAMKRRGVVVRHELPAQLREHVDALASAMGVPANDLGIEGKDGTGLKTEIPWIRVFSRERSPSATSGWFVVYLLSATGDRVYLSLMQGTTVWNGSDFTPRKPAELRARVDWALPLIAGRATGRDDLVREIRLHARKSQLGAGYEAGSVVALEYERDNIPDSKILAQDLIFMVELLSDVYEAEASSPYVPGNRAPEVLEALEAAAMTAGRRGGRLKRQGFRLSAEERRAIELYSVRMATDYFEAQGWSVTDVGERESYDLLMTKGAERLHAEVKGTTSTGGEVVLTRAEVETQRSLSPHNALVVVHSIVLDRSTTPPTVSGGTLRCASPWTIEEDDLTVVSYLYRTGL
ncbi:MrcB family domain-containing protein [Microbispora rosea]|uniref:MrcB family domain-containing protein n=1 Tax=Microbispora rosea TaxID=58117 RepID=UPI00379A9E8A